MAEPHFSLPKVAISLDKERVLCFPNRSLKRLFLEQKIDGVEWINSKPSVEAVPPLVWAGCLWEDPELDFKTVEDFILDELGANELRDLTVAVITCLRRKREEDDKPPDPPSPSGEASL
jgi:hypothetical protein